MAPFTLSCDVTHEQWTAHLFPSAFQKTGTLLVAPPSLPYVLAISHYA
jgi:hypothetical protein